jgi:integrase
VVRLGDRYRRTTFPLGTANRKEAARAAKQIHEYLSANGWEKTLERYKTLKRHCPPLTIGQYLELASKHAEVKPATLTANVRCLRQILAGAFGYQAPGSAKYDYRGQERSQWIKRLDVIPLDRLTPERINTWRREFIAQAGDDQRVLKSRRISAGSILRQAGSLFTPRLLELIKPEGLSENPFTKVPRVKRPSQRYRSETDFAKLIDKALKELALVDPQAFAAFLLLGFAGLRRSEADSLRWDAFHFDEGFIRIATTSDFGGKSAESLADIHLEPEIITLFRAYQASSRGPFVLESDRKPKPDATFARYRAEATFKRLLVWLRTHGIDNEKPLHTLRKEFGAQLAKKHGILAASIALRHSDIGVTRSHYVDDRTRATVGLGHLIGQPDNVIALAQEQPEDRKGQAL